jgi:protein phosphatase
MSRFGANPKWIIYLPPTMSPAATSRLPGLLEQAAEAFSYFHGEGVSGVVCEEKHMGSRAVVIVCRDESAARRHFGVEGEGMGICYTRTGRRFFEDPVLEAEFLDAVSDAVTRAGLWDEFRTEWICLDCEVMPWSAKAQELLKDDYAAVGSASNIALGEAVTVLGQAAARGAEVDDLLESFRTRRELGVLLVESYRRYCWPVRSLSDLKLAPFHLLATEGAVHTDKDHLWHMDIVSRLCQPGAGLFAQTGHTVVELGNPSSEQAAVEWWEALTESGGEGIVVKPLDFITRGRRGLVQPAVKCRGAEYLRIIYGPDYTLRHNLERLRQRSVGTKRSLALREFALGIEGLERFVRKEPLRRVHECVLGVLGLESEPVDPRL